MYMVWKVTSFGKKDETAFPTTRSLLQVTSMREIEEVVVVVGWSLCVEFEESSNPTK